jgi:methylenetetrahydrofolate dehydrogenase (NADP+)/methenyltetrahydrofolate cyclohydrolase
MVKPDSVVIDVGIHRIDDATKKNGYRLIGDVDFEKIAPKCAYITPVPGGVGPMTIASLLMNTYKSANERN